MKASSICTSNADDFFGPRVEACRRQFDFTLLFEQSVLSIAPSALFICLISLRVAQLYRVDRKTLSNTLRNVKLVTKSSKYHTGLLLTRMQIAILILLFLQIAILALWAMSKNQRTRITLPSAVISVVATIGLALLSNLENSRSARPSLLICTYLFISILLDIPQTRTLWLQVDSKPLASLSTCTILVKPILLSLEAFEKRSFLREPYRSYPPEALAGVISRSLFWWLNLLIQKGQKCILGLGDLYATDSALSSSYLETRLQASWRRRSLDGKYSLLIAMLSCFKGPLAILIFPRICLIGFKFSQPLLINRIISLIGEPETALNKDIGYGLIGATAVIYLGLAISTAQYRHQIYRVITMIRGGLTCLIYNATLSLDTNSIGDSAAITLMSTDIERIGAGLTTIDSLWAGPIEAGIAIFLLQRELGMACFAPLVTALGKLALIFQHHY